MPEFNKTIKTVEIKKVLHKKNDEVEKNFLLIIYFIIFL